MVTANLNGAGTMRDEVRKALVDAVPAFGGRVYQPSAPALKPNLVKPFAVVRVATLAQDGEWESRKAAVSVWMGVNRGSYGALDDLAIDVEKALDNLRLTDAEARPYILRYAGSTTAEQEDAEYDALIREQSYLAERLDWLRPLGAAPDPVGGMATWTKQRFPFAGTDPLTWDPRDATPGVYWRLDRGGTLSTALEDDAMHGYVQLSLKGHVVAEGSDARLNLARRIVSALALEGDRYVRIGEGTSNQVDAWIDEATFDGRADPYADGQVTLRIRVPAQVLDDWVDYVPGPTMDLAHLAFDAMEDGTVDVRVDVPIPPPGTVRARPGRAAATAPPASIQA